MVSLSEDAINAVPQSLREASYALGANRWETMRSIVLPAASPASWPLSYCRSDVRGETMVVLMCTGNSQVTGNILDSVQAMTSAIAIDVGEVAGGSLHYHVLFAWHDPVPVHFGYQHDSGPHRRPLLGGVQMNRKLKQSIYFGLFRVSGWAVVAAIAVLIGYLLFYGIGAINWEFLTQAPRVGMSKGGIFPQLLGTIYLMALVLIISIPIGILSAVYLVEYQKNKFMKGVWRVVVHNLAGVPSVVYGLLGLGLFVLLLDMGASLIAAGLTLSILVLPIIIASTREALLAIPPSLREASIALGATKWQTVRHHILPYAMPGILTGVILSLSRAAGETADNPGGCSVLHARPAGLPALRLPGLTIPHIRAGHPDQGGAHRQSLYGSALVLMLVVGMNLVAIMLRNKYRKKYRW